MLLRAPSQLRTLPSCIAQVPDLKIGQSMMAMMLGAVCALATPVGFATNLMVQARAGET